MSSEQDKQSKKAAKAALKVAKKGQMPSGGAFPPPPEAVPWYKQPSWLRVILAALALVIGVVSLVLSMQGSTGSANSGLPATPTPAPASEAVHADAPAPAADAATSGETGLPQPAPDHGLTSIEFLAGGGKPDQVLPLIIAVHGLGDSPDSFRRLFAGFPVPARVVVPQGPIAYGRGFSWFPTTIRNGKVTRLDHDVMAESANRLAGLAEELSARWPTAGKPVITGFSQGGILSYLVAVRHPHSIAGAVPISGLIPDQLMPAVLPDATSRPSIMALHGEADTLVPYASARTTVERLKELGAPAVLESFPDTGHTISGPMRARLFELIVDLLPERVADYFTSAMYASMPNSAPVASLTN